MAFEPDFLEMMPHTVTIAPWVSRTAAGVDVFGAPVAYRARIVGKILSLRRAERSDRTVIFDVYLHAGTAVITSKDKLTLDGDAAWVDGTPIIFAVARSTDEDGHHHVKLQCGWQYHRQGQ